VSAPGAHTRPLAGLRLADAARFGGKSAGLGELLAASIPVPAGFAVAADAYTRFVTEAGLAGRIDAALAGLEPSDSEGAAAASKAIAEELRSAPVPEEVRVEVASSYAALGDGDPAVAVRSSAIGEDAADATFAGLQESYLWVRGAGEVASAVRDCWVSLFTPQALSYRARMRAGESPAMGVTVQLMVDAAVSGVMFTCNPVSGDPSVVAINASWGLGLAVVGGEVTPDYYLVSKVTGEIVRRRVERKEIEYVAGAHGRGALHREVEPQRVDAACLDDGRLAELVELARAVQNHFGSHQDVEWAIDRDGRLAVVQSRPVTAVAKPAERSQQRSAMSLLMGTFGAPTDD